MPAALLCSEVGACPCDPGSRRDVEAYWATLRDASAHGHAAGNAAARDVHGKAGFVLALCDAFRRVDESRS